MVFIGDKAKFCSSPGNKFFQDLLEWYCYILHFNLEEWLAMIFSEN